jgi:hypothetical protein
MGLGYVSLSKSPLSSAVRKTPTSGLPELIEAARFQRGSRSVQSHFISQFQDNPLYEQEGRQERMPVALHRRLE